MEAKDQDLNGIDIAEGKEPQEQKSESKKEEIHSKMEEKKFSKEDSSKSEDVSSSKTIEKESQSDVKNLEEENQTLKDQIEKLKSQVEQYKDSWARERAEFTNYRKRIQQEILQAKNLGVEEFVKKLLSVIDNLDMVLSAKTENSEVQNFIYGVNMIRDEFLKVLEGYSIKPYVKKGDKFNPILMEAIDMEIRDDLKEEIVLEVYKKAYIRINPQKRDQYTILRTATVKVGKPKKESMNTNQENTRDHTNSDNHKKNIHNINETKN